MKIIKFIYATITLHNLCVWTPIQTNWITDDGECDSDSEQGSYWRRWVKCFS